MNHPTSGPNGGSPSNSMKKMVRNFLARTNINFRVLLCFQPCTVIQVPYDDEKHSFLYPIHFYLLHCPIEPTYSFLKNLVGDHCLFRDEDGATLKQENSEEMGLHRVPEPSLQV